MNCIFSICSSTRWINVYSSHSPPTPTRISADSFSFPSMTIFWSKHDKRHGITFSVPKYSHISGVFILNREFSSFAADSE